MRLLPVLAAACAGAAPPVPDDTDVVDATGLVVVSQNAGTSTFLDLIEPSDLRPTCADHYSNNLCTLDAEAALREALDDVRPHLAFLQEMWHAPECDAPGRPAEVQAPPFVCSAEGDQLARVLPDDLSWACAAAYPDNCIAWDPSRFEPDAPCPDRDCSAAMEDLPSPCSRAGRIALVDGTLDGAAATLVVVHTNSGPFVSDQTCRAGQLEVLEDALLARGDRAFVLGGDVNHDPDTTENADALAFRALLASTGARRLPDDGDTARLLPYDLDVVVARGVMGDGACTLRFVDEDRRPAMFDHALVTCR